MAPETTVYELFDQYLSGELSGADKTAFEQRLRDEPDVQEQFNLYKNLQADFSLMERSREQEAAVTQTMAGFSRQYFTATGSTKGKVVSIKRRWYMVAAAASLLFAFFLLKPLLFTASSDGDLFGAWYEEEPLGATRGDTDSASRAATLFDAKKYSEAIAILEPYTIAHPESTNLLMARGACYLQTGAFAKATATFAPIAGGPTVYAARAQWLLAMVQLKQDNKPACKPLLEAIPESSAYYKRAQALLRKL